MSLMQNTVGYFYLILYFISLCTFSCAVPTGVAEVLKLNNFSYMMMVLLQPPDGDEEIKGRVKRQTGAGKFSDAAKMSPTKVMQLYLQMFKNLVSTEPIGGVHPMSKSSVKPVVKLFKQRIIAFFFPDVGEEKV